MSTASSQPFWGDQTSFLNFCEEDYVVTRYVAEFVNTLSSLSFVILGLYGLFNKNQGPRTGTRIILYGGLIGVGICSGAYHMTLKYHTQMSDELSMHLLTTPLVYSVITVDASPQRKKMIGSILFAIFTVVMVTHMVMDEFILHATVFGLGVCIIGVQVTRLTHRHVTEPYIRKKIQITGRLGCLSFLLGYFLWLVDDWVCSQLISMRHAIGIPFAFLLELHGWWHIGTAFGGYVAIAVVDLITSEEELTEDCTDHLAWPISSLTNYFSGASAPKRVVI